MAAHTIPVDYGDAGSEMRAIGESCGLADRSDLARLLGDGPDLLDLLQRLSTADMAGLAPGQGKATVLTTNKGRIVERLFVNRLEASVLLVGGAGDPSRVLDYLKRYTFAEKTGLADAAGTVDLYTIAGPAAGDALKGAGLGVPDPLQSSPGELADASVTVLGHDGVSADGYTVVVDHGHDLAWDTLRQSVERAGGRRVGAQALEAFRIIRGLGAAGSELTEDHNPLEAGLWDAVSFDKGCYVGQEVVARLRTYDKVSKALWLLRLPEGVPAPEPGTRLFSEGREVGRISSSVIPPGWSHAVALAYVKHKNVKEGSPLGVGSAEATLHASATTPPIHLEDN